MIRYYQEDTSFDLKQKLATRRWLKRVAETHLRRIGSINIIFCSDPYLLEVNKQFLRHSYYTDIITFDYCEGNVLSGDLFISVDSVRENASFYGVSFADELDRVMVHGLLHLIGFDDATDAQQAKMRQMENESLAMREK